MLDKTVALADVTDKILTAILVPLDMMFSSVIVTPMVVAYWRGTWNLMSFILYPDNLLWSGIGSCVIGTVGHFIFTYYQEKFSRNFHPDKHRITFMIISRIYTAIYGIVCVNGWRGGWTLTDIYVPQHVLMIFAIISIILLIFCKGLRNISSAPFALSTDRSKDYFAVPTMLKASASNQPGFFFIDCAFSVVVIGTLVIFVWQSVWKICDLLIYESDANLSAWVSLAIGYGTVVVTFALQSLIKCTCNRLTGFWRVAVADALTFLSFIGSLNVWRGIWNLLELHFLPNDIVLSNLLSYGLSFIFLAMLNCANSLLNRGALVDAEEPAEQCTIFPVYYIRLCIAFGKRLKKLLRPVCH